MYMINAAANPSELIDPDALLDLLFAASPYGLVYQDASTRILAANGRAQEILGLSATEVEGKTSYDEGWRAVRADGSVFPPEEHPVSVCLATRRPVRGVIMGVWNPAEGRRRWMRLDAFPRFDPPSPEPVGVLVWIADVTTEVAAREAEARSLDRFHSLFDNMAEGVAVHEMVRDAEGRAIDYRILETNAHYERHVGISREAAVGRLGSEVYGLSPAPYMREFCGVAESGRPHQFETYFPPLDKHFLISVAPFGPDGFATIFFDISATKRAEAERERLLAELERKNKELESLVYVASHDLRAPLVNIQGFGQRLGRDCAELATLSEAAAARAAECDAPEAAEAARQAAEVARERVPRSLEFIRTSGAKMDKLISGLLRLSRTGRVELIKERLDMARLLGEVVKAEQYQAEKAGASIEIGALPPCVGDGEQIGQVFSNLIDNAIKYRSPDRPLRVSVSGEAAGGESRYVVEDNGIGIAPEHLEKVWELFYRLDPADSAGGEGLGLSLVRRIVDRHGGRALAESVPGEGSRFVIYLPSGGAR
jgi:PAS domain S-box-containing protein